MRVETSAYREIFGLLTRYPIPLVGLLTFSLLTSLSEGLGLGVVIYMILSVFGLPVLLVYGVVRGLGQSTPHGVILEVAGALLGRYYFYKRYGSMWRQYAPVLLAGFSCGMGLTGMFAMGFALIMKSLSFLAY